MKNYWLDRKLTKKRLDWHRKFMQALATGGSIIVDWEAVNKYLEYPPPEKTSWDISFEE